MLNYKPPSAWYRRVAPVLILALGTTASVLVWSALRQDQLEAIRDLGRAESVHVAGLIRSELNSRILPLRRMAFRWEKSEGTPRAAWMEDAKSHYLDLPGFQAIEWIDTNYHVRWIYPLEGNEQAQDLDLAREERRRLALERARASRTISITSTIELVQGGRGFLVYVPIFVEDRFQGFILGAFRVREFLDTILGSESPGIALSLFDGDTPIYSRGQPSATGDRERLGAAQDIEFLGLRWRLAVHPAAMRFAIMRTVFPEAVLVASLLLFALAAAAVYLAHTAGARLRVIELLRETSIAATEATSAEEHFERCIESICRCTGWPVGHVYQVDRATGLLMPTDIWYLANDRRFSAFREVTAATRFEQGVGLPGRVLAKRAPAWIADVTSDPNFPRAKLASDIGVRGAFAFPVMIGGEVVAVLEFFTERTAIPDHSLLDLMGRIGIQSGQVMERQQAAAENQRLRIENELILNSAGEGVYGLDVRGHTTFANPAAVRMLGYTLEEMLDHPQHDLIHHSHTDGSSYRREECSIFAAVEDGIVHTVADEVFWRRDGSSFPVEYTSTPIYQGGEITGAVVVFRDITERKQSEKQLLDLSMKDPLTGLPNRRSLDERLQLEWRNAYRQRNPISVVMIDADYFKDYNDAYGHPAGDACLKELGQALFDATRRPRDFVARFGGEEFAAILPETDEAGALVVAESIRAHIEALEIAHERSSTGFVTVSLGIASTIPGEDQAHGDLVVTADDALYRAKQAGRNRAMAATERDDTGAPPG